MKTIQQLIDAPIVGNAYHDQQLMNDIHQFVINDNNSMDDKIAALKKLDQVMGLDDMMVDSDSVLQYIKESN